MAPMAPLWAPPRVTEAPQDPKMDPDEPQDSPRSMLGGLKWPPERSLDVHFAVVFSMFFESPRFDAEDGGGDGPRPQMERRNVDFGKTSRKRLRNARPEAPSKHQMNPKMDQTGPKRNSKIDPRDAQSGPTWPLGRPMMVLERPRGVVANRLLGGLLWRAIAL